MYAVVSSWSCAHGRPDPPGSVNSAVVSSVPAAESNRRTVTCGPLCTSKSKCEGARPPRRRTPALASNCIGFANAGSVRTRRFVASISSQPVIRQWRANGSPKSGGPNGHRASVDGEVRRVDFTTSSFPPHCRSTRPACRRSGNRRSRPVGCDRRVAEVVGRRVQRAGIAHRRLARDLRGRRRSARRGLARETRLPEIQIAVWGCSPENSARRGRIRPALDETQPAGIGGRITVTGVAPAPRGRARIPPCPVR